MKFLSMRWLVLAAFLLPSLGGCADQKPKMLGIEGYNYTDRYIDSFDVGGQGGGNVELSDATTGGGKTVCCVVYNPRTPLPVKMKVRWVWGVVEDANYKVIRPQQKGEAEAEIAGPVPDDPQFLEVHFMPDGSVRLLITSERSAPLIKIDRGTDHPTQ